MDRPEKEIVASCSCEDEKQAWLGSYAKSNPTFFFPHQTSTKMECTIMPHHVCDSSSHLVKVAGVFSCLLISGRYCLVSSKRYYTPGRIAMNFLSSL